MEIKSAQFIRSAVLGNNFFSPNIMQIAFYGRSNVGKSSSINALLGRSGLAKSSGTPGKTTEANFFEINDQFYVVDLPGYGFARLSKSRRRELQELINWYITTPVIKRHHVIVIDAKVGMTDHDHDMLAKIHKRSQEAIILLNKMDKLNQKDSSAILRTTTLEAGQNTIIVPFSATKKNGVQLFWESIEKQGGLTPEAV
ncbi:MAG: GTP-binding protein [Planctomycetota bacterium]|jgi:GTP-binding protein